jgi:hypothetical protein
MAKAPGNGSPDFVEDRQIVPCKSQDFGIVAGVGIRALDVGLTAKFVRQRPAQSIDDQPAFNAENDMAEEGDPTGRSDIGPYPPGGSGISFEKAGESGPTLARMDIHRPARNLANHGLRREIVVSCLTWFAWFAGQKGGEREQHAAAPPEPLARDLDN